MASQSALLTIRAALRRRVEIEESLELRADAGDVRLDLLGDEQHALLRLAARIADHAGAAADQRDRRMAGALQARQRHHRQQRPDVQARGGRIEADVGRDALAREQLGQPVGRVGDQPAPGELVEEVRIAKRLLYQSMRDPCDGLGARPREQSTGRSSRRDAQLKTLLAGGVGAATAPACTALSTSATRSA